MKKLIFIGISLAVFVSCEKEANIPLPKADRLPVVMCAVSPELKEIKAKVEWSDPIFENNEKDGAPIDNAAVTISNGTSSITLTYDQWTEEYSADTAGFQLIPGKTYTLTVSADGKTLTSKTVIPQNKIAAVNSFDVELVYTDSSFNNWNGYAQTEVKFNDIAGEANYYYIIHYPLVKDPFTGDTMELRGIGYYFDDVNRDGAEISGKSVFGVYYYSGSQIPVGVRSVLCTINKEYYDYLVTAGQGSYSSPFSEPVMVKSNVEGGFGCYTGYRLMELEKYY